MSSLGERITALRKAKGVTQEEMGKALGVSMQAVSRWENGGAPDTMLLPALADYFSIRIDELFGRSAGADSVETALLTRLDLLPQEECIGECFRLCWQFQKGIAGEKEYRGDDDFNRFKSSGYTTSRMLFDSGMTEMRMGKKHNWYFLSPEPEEGRYETLYNREEHTKLYKLLSEPDAYDALFLIFQRTTNPFTAKFLERALNIPHGRAVEILRQFEEFQLVRHSDLDLDDEQITIYNVNASAPYIIPFLTFTQEIVSPPMGFNYNFGGRNTPLIRKADKEETK